MRIIRRAALLLALLAAVGVGLYVWRTRPEPDAAAEDSTGARLAELRGKRLEVPGEKKRCVVRGKVTAKQGGEPIAGAVVLLTRDELPWGRSSDREGPWHAISDETGTWSIDQIRAGRYAVSVSALDHLPGEVSAFSACDATASALDVALEVGGALLTGTIHDIGGGPIAGARVSANNWRDMLTRGRPAPGIATIADDQGVYRLQLPEGSYIARASHPDYVEETRQAAIAAPRRQLDFRLVPAGRIAGRVLSREDGQPVAGASVHAKGRLGDRFGFNWAGAESRSDGTFLLTGIKSGALEVTAEGAGFVSARPTMVEAGIAEHIEGVEVWVQPGATVSGFVVRRGSERRGIAEVLVILAGMRSSFAAADGATAQDGYFEIRGVSPGTYRVIATTGMRMLDLDAPAVTVGDADIDDLVLVADPGVKLSGRVEPRTAATIRLEPTDPGQTASLMTVAMSHLFTGVADQNGEFTIPGVVAGSYRVVAEADGGATGSTVATVGDADVTGILISLEPRASLSGRVVDAGGRPVGDVQVQVTPSLGGPGGFGNFFGMARNFMTGGAPTGPAGEFEVVGLAPGDYDVRVYDRRGQIGWALGGDEAERMKPVQASIHGTEGRTGLTLTVENRDGSIRGKVLDSQGEPLPDAWVTAAYKGEARPFAFGSHDSEEPALTDADGEFAFEGLRDGAYELTAQSSHGNQRVRQEGVKPGSRVVLRLEEGCSLTVRVRSKGAVAAFEASLSGPGTRLRGAGAQDGAHTFDRLDSGHYTLSVSADDGYGAAEVDLQPAATEEIEVELTPWSSVRGRLIDAESKQPISSARITVMAREVRVPSSFADVFSPRTTDEDGRFVLDKVPAGEVRLMFTRGMTDILRVEGGGEPFRGSPMKELELTPGQTVDLGTLEAKSVHSLMEMMRGHLPK